MARRARRQLLQTEHGPLHLRAERADPDADLGRLATQPLWWPPSKMPSHWLAPHLAASRPQSGPMARAPDAFQ
jgi:hypothetical protein